MARGRLMIGVALALALVGTTVAYAPPHRGLQRVSVRANVAPSVTMLAAKGKKKKKAPSKKRAGSGPAGSNTGFAQPSEASPSALADGEAQPGVPGGALPPMDGEDAVDMASVSPAASVDIASVRENGAQTAQRVPQAGSSVHLLTADLSQYRLAREARNEDILQALRSAIAEDRLDAFVRANRDMLIKRFQVWMMAEALRRRAAGEQAAADEIRTALSRVIVANREFDEPLAAAIAGREKALNQAFEQGSSGGEAPTIIDLAGGTPLEQLGFWVVIASAKEAWLDRLAETEEQDTSLREAISRKVGQMDQFLEAIQLTKELQVPPIPTLLQAMSTDSVSQEDIDDDLIFRTGSIIGCLECLRYQSYSALATRLVAFRDIISTGGLRPLDVGAPLDVEPEISRASADGSLSSLIKYEIEQAKIDTRDQTVKLGELLGISREAA